MFNLIIKNYTEFSVAAKKYASQFNPCVILDSCEIVQQMDKKNYKLVIGFGGSQVIEPKENKLQSLYENWSQNKCWIFGVLGYNLKNEFENLGSNSSIYFNWPDLVFFKPTTVITVDWDDKLTIIDEESEQVYKSILGYEILKNEASNYTRESEISVDFDNKTYNEIVNRIKNEIVNGNVYELNLCSRFSYKHVTMDSPFSLFNNIQDRSPSPFSAYLNIGNKYVMSASPERYLFKNRNSVVSQPIKGTRPRGKNKLEDDFFIHDLLTNKKDQAENVMIVDLVRNDMARVAKPGSVRVEELLGLYSYSHVHQLVSTISCEVDDTVAWKEIIQASFPMGSMTGAPKISAMNLIDQFEKMNREWYSGALGYVDPEGNFDFNVLIRTLFYDSFQGLLAYYAGGAITIDSNCDEEYSEMLIKTKAINDLLESVFKKL